MAADDDHTPLDALVVGGGPAGLSAALVLARARRRVVVVDEGRGRNAVAGHVHGYLGHDGTPPDELLARARQEVTRYGGTIVAGRAEEIHTPQGGPPTTRHTQTRAGTAPSEGVGPLSVRLSSGETLQARHVVVATGLRDELPSIPGLAERWGKDVLHCPYCHGWEHRGEQMVVLVTAPEELDKVFTMRQWSPTVRVVLHDLTLEDLGPDDAERLTALDVPVESGPVRELTLAGDDDAARLVGVRLADGTQLPCDVVVVQPRLRANDELLVGAGAHVEGDEFGQQAQTGERGRTAVPSLWAVGNVSELDAQVVTAAAAGHRVAVAIDHALTREAVDRAVAEHRRRSAPP